MTTDEKLLRIESSLKEIDSTLDIILKKIAVPKTQRVMEVKHENLLYTIQLHIDCGEHLVMQMPGETPDTVILIFER